jgi:hypothetical protein
LAEGFSRGETGEDGGLGKETDGGPARQAAMMPQGFDATRDSSGVRNVYSEFNDNNRGSMSR